MLGLRVRTVVERWTGTRREGTGIRGKGDEGGGGKMEKEGKGRKKDEG